jgi:hypothetical protein
MLSKSLILMVLGAEIEPAWAIKPGDFKFPMIKKLQPTITNKNN